MKKAALYGRTATPNQNFDSQFIQLRDIAAQRGFKVTGVYNDCGISAKAKRPGIKALLRDARGGKFSVILVVALDRLATSTRNLLQVVDDLESLGIELISAREAIDTSTPAGQMFVKTVQWITELERNIGRDRIRAGLRRRRLEGLPVGRPMLNVDRTALVYDRLTGMSLTQVAKKYSLSRASVVRFVREAHQSDSAGLRQFLPEMLRVEACAA